MIRYLTNLLDVATERRFRAFLLGVGAAAVVTMFAMASLGFGAFAAYGYLRPVVGPMGAALVLCGTFGLLALVIGAFTWTRRRARRMQANAAASTPAENVNSFLQGFIATGAPDQQSTLDAATRFARDITPMQLVALALIGGFTAGRKLRK
jgi:uncharacterized membrane protein